MYIDRKKYLRKSCGCILLVFLMLIPCLFVNASVLSVSPTHIDLTSHNPIASLQLGNNDTKPVVVHISLVKWTQKDGKDIYTKTSNLIVTPPVVQIAPRDFQIVRVGMLSPAQALNLTDEASYRMLINEIPPKLKSLPGVQMVLHISLPVFINPVQEHANLQWHWQKVGASNLAIDLNNVGNVHTQISQFKFYYPGQIKPFATKEVFNCILPHQAAKWNFKLPSPILGKVLKIIVVTNKGEISENATLVSS